MQVRDARIGGVDSSDAPILDGVLRAGEVYAFTMCNPPFFEDMDEAGRNPGTACGGTAAEMVCTGGEGAFVARHIQESRLPHVAPAVRWFTTLCGKKATLRAAVVLLRDARAPAVRTACFSQGRTARWGLAWSWQADAAATRPLPLPAQPAARPCARASFTLRVGRDRAAPSAALHALREALAAAPDVRECALDAATFSVSGALAHAAGDDEPQVGRKRAQPSDGGDDDAPPAAPASSSFAAKVQEQAPGTLMVSMQLRGEARGELPLLPAQRAFGALVRRVESALRTRWPAG